MIVGDRVAPAIKLPRTISRHGRQLVARPVIGEARMAVASVRLGRAVLARATVPVRATGRLTVRLKPSRGALAKLLRTRRKIVLEVRATDGAGNARTEKRTVKLRR